MMTKLRIPLADDHLAMREGLKALINAQPDSPTRQKLL
jgi:hypothetical protein